MTDQLIIDGARCDASDGATFDVTGPATATVVGSVAKAGAAEVDRALSIAAKAHDDATWGGVSATDRGRVLRGSPRCSPSASSRSRRWR